jgi:hypothetical protein
LALIARFTVIQMGEFLVGFALGAYLIGAIASGVWFFLTPDPGFGDSPTIGIQTVRALYAGAFWPLWVVTIVIPELVRWK